MLVFLLAAHPAFPGQPITDCPLAETPYSSQTVLLDLLLDPAAKATIERDAPEFLHGPQAEFLSRTEIPTFANIISPARMLEGSAVGRAEQRALDRDLALIPITLEATLKRCARYDREKPILPAVLPHPALLIFDKITGFRDGSSVDAGTAALKAMAVRRAWTLVFTDKAGVFNARDLSRFDAVVWNNVSGDALTLAEESAFRRWLEGGGGFAGFHGSGGDLFYVWDWYADALIGARFREHPFNPQFQAARVVVSQPGVGVAHGLPASWTMTEEWYSFYHSPSGIGTHVVATLDESSYSPVGPKGEDLRMGDHPIAWTRCLANGRSFYSAIGHRPESYAEVNSSRLLEQGIAWAAGLGDTACAGGKEVPKLAPVIRDR
jgi:type 1 glutamine amidotransferase